MRHLGLLAFAAAFALSGIAQTAASEFDQSIVTAARDRIGKTVHYDPSYVGLGFPDGDVAQDRGVCTDVIIRAMRASHNIDLQARVNADMKQAFSQYPNNWGHKTTDRNIDHRRVPNLQVYFTRQGMNLPVTSEPTAFQPGDIVTSMLPGNLPHMAIVSEKRGPSGNPMIIHNIGAGTREEDRLFEYPLTGHYRPSLANW